MTSADATAMSTGHRLHISGLTPQISPADLKERFQRYGNVQSVDTVGPDALGQPRNFVYLTIDAKQQDLTKCINSMQNSIWRGAKLKIAPAKKSYEERLAFERLTEVERKATLDEKESRKLRIKERKDRKRRLARAGGGRQSGDMRLMTVENWKNEGDIWRGKYWHLTPSHHLIRPIFTRPTHPLHMKPVSKASESIEVVSKGGKINPYEALGTLGKKAKKPRSLPPKRAMRMLLDPFRYGHMHLNGAILDGANSEPPQMPEGTWEFSYDDIRQDDISSQMDPSLVSGKWIYHASGPSQESHVADDGTIQAIPGKRKRVADQLHEIAANSLFPDTVQDVEGKQVNKKSKTGQSGSKNAKAAGGRTLSLDEDDVAALDDYDIWGTAPAVVGKESVSLFDSSLSKQGLARATAPSPAKPVTKTVVHAETEDLSDVDFDDDDALFGEAVTQPSSPLFTSTKASIRQDESTDKAISEDESEDASTDRVASTGVGMSLSKFARSEKQKGLSVLQALGIDLADKDKLSSELEEAKGVSFDEDEDVDESSKAALNTATPQLAWLYDDDEDDEPVETFRHATRRLSDTRLPMGDPSAEEMDDSDSGSSTDHSDAEIALSPAKEAKISTSKVLLPSASVPVKTAAGQSKTSTTAPANTTSGDEDSSDSSEDDASDGEKGDGDKQPSGDGNGAQNNGGGGKKPDDDDEDDSDSDSDTESEDDESSSEEEDEKENGNSEKRSKGKQSLKDMFVAQPESTGFSLMAGLDLELDSDLELDEANPFQAPATIPREEDNAVSTFAHVPTVDANAVFNASSSNEPFFFGTTGRPAAQTEDLQEGWMSKITVGGMEKKEVEVQPFWQTETDEQMAQLWNDQKRELTKEYKKRHREALKRQKRGMGGAGSSAAGGAMDVD